MVSKNLPQNQINKEEGSKKEQKRRKAAATLETELFTADPVKRVGASVFLYYLLTGVLGAMLLGAYSFLYFGDVQASVTPEKKSPSPVRVVEASLESTIEKPGAKGTPQRKDKSSFPLNRSTQKSEPSVSAEPKRSNEWNQVKMEILGEFSGVLYSLENEKAEESIFEEEEYQEALWIDGKLVLAIRARVWEKIEGQKKVELLRRVHKLAQVQSARTTPPTDLKLIVLKFDDGRQDLVLSVADKT